MYPGTVTKIRWTATGRIPIDPARFRCGTISFLAGAGLRLNIVRERYSSRCSAAPLFAEVSTFIDEYKIKRVC